MRKSFRKEDTELLRRMTTGKIGRHMDEEERFGRNGNDPLWIEIEIGAETDPAEAVNRSIPPPNGTALPMVENIVESDHTPLENLRVETTVDLVISNAVTTMIIVKLRVHLHQGSLPRHLHPLRMAVGSTIVVVEEQADVEEEVEVVMTIGIILLPHHRHRISRIDAGVATIGTKMIVAAEGKILESPLLGDDLMEKNVGSMVADEVRISIIRSQDHQGSGMTIMGVATEIRETASSEEMTSKIVVLVVVTHHQWEVGLRIVVGAIAVPCSIQTSEAEVTLVAEAVAIVIASMVLRSAVASVGAGAVVVHMTVAVAADVVVGGFPTRKAGAFTRIEI